MLKQAGSTLISTFTLFFFLFFPQAPQLQRAIATRPKASTKTNIFDSDDLSNISSTRIKDHFGNETTERTEICIEEANKNDHGMVSLSLWKKLICGKKHQIPKTLNAIYAKE